MTKIYITVKFPFKDHSIIRPACY